MVKKIRVKNMNILFVNPTKRLRVVVKELSKRLAKEGYNIVILTPQPIKSLINDNLDLNIIVYPSIFLPKIRYTIPDFFRQLLIIKRIVRKENIDIIHVFTYFYPSVWIPILYAKINGIPVVLTTDCFPGISWRYGSKFVDFIAKIYSKTIGKFIFRLCDKIILMSNEIVKDARNLGIREDKIVVIPNGVDFNRFNLKKINQQEIRKIRRELCISENEAIILNVSRLVRVKRIDILIKITKRLLEKGLRVKTVIVGDGPYSREYEKLAKMAKIENNILFTGFRTDIPLIMKVCDIFVLPSLSEGLPTVLLEASACCKPVIATNTGGIPDIITHGKTGFLVEPENINSFVFFIEKLLYNKSLSKKLGKNAYKHVRKKFNWNLIIKRYKDIYAELVAR